jgi:hypothetical protein
MELVSGFLLWLTDVFGIKWVKQKGKPITKILRTMIFLIVGIVLVTLFFVFWY